MACFGWRPACRTWIHNVFVGCVEGQCATPAWTRNHGSHPHFRRAHVKTKVTMLQRHCPRHCAQDAFDKMQLLHFFIVGNVMFARCTPTFHHCMLSTAVYLDVRRVIACGRWTNVGPSKDERNNHPVSSGEARRAQGNMRSQCGDTGAAVICRLVDKISSTTWPKPVAFIATRKALSLCTHGSVQ